MAQPQVIRARGPVSGTAVKPARRRAPFVVEFWRSAVAKKWVMAITGVMLIGFVVAHMVGNLKMYTGTHLVDGREVYHLDEYGEFLRELLVPILPRTVTLWLLRLGLIGAFALHIHAAVALTRMNQKARPIKYQSQRDYVAASFASRTMRITGLVFALYLLFHLADLTWGFANPDFKRGEVMHNLEASLTRIPVAVIYILGNLALGVHLFHGAWSMFQSLGWNNPRFNKARRYFATGLAAIVVIGNMSFVIAWVTELLTVKA